MVVSLRKIDKLIKLNTDHKFIFILSLYYPDIVSNLKNSSISHKSILYQASKLCLENYQYIVDQNKLAKELNKYQSDHSYSFQYKEIKKIKEVIKEVLLEKLDEEINREFKILSEEKKINSAIAELVKKKDISLNKYYPITERTTDEAIYFLNQKIYNLQQEKVFKAFHLTLLNQNKSLPSILQSVSKKSVKREYLLYNLLMSLKEIDNIDIEYFYKEIINIEKVLNKDYIYSLMTTNGKELYRKKILKKRKPYQYVSKLIDEKKHIGFYLFKHSNPLFCIDYSNSEIPDTSKVVINIFSYFTCKEEVDSCFKFLKNNTRKNIYFHIINHNLLLENEVLEYVQEKCSSLNISFYQSDEEISYSKNIKYVMNFKYGNSFDFTRIKLFVGIMDHPLNKVVFHKGKEKVKNGIYLLFFPTRYSSLKLFHLVYQKEEALFSSNVFYHRKVYQKLLSFTKEEPSDLFLKKGKGACYLKNEYIESKRIFTLSKYLEEYYHFVEKEFSRFRGASFKNKMLLFFRFWKEFLYLVFFIGLFTPFSLYFFIVGIIILCFYQDSLNIFLRIFKSFYEFSTIPTTLFNFCYRKKGFKGYFLQIFCFLVLLAFGYWTGIIFLISFFLSFLMQHVNVSKKKKKVMAKIATSKNLSCERELSSLDTSILSNEYLACYTDSDYVSTYIYGNEPIFRIDYLQDIRLDDLDSEKKLKLQQSSISFSQNKVVIREEFKDISLIIFSSISLNEKVEIKKFKIENHSKRNMRISFSISFSTEFSGILDSDESIIIHNIEKEFYLSSYLVGADFKNFYYQDDKLTLVLEKTLKHQEEEFYLVVSISQNDSFSYLVNYQDPLQFQYLLAVDFPFKADVNYLVLSYLYHVQKAELNDSRRVLLSYNTMDVTYLEKFNLSINIPIILLDLAGVKDHEVIQEVLYFFHYSILHHYQLQLILLNYSVQDNYIDEIIYHIYEDNFLLKNSSGGIYKFSEDDLTEDEIILFYTLSYLTIDARNCPSLEKYILKMQKKISIPTRDSFKEINSLPVSIEQKEDFSFYQEDVGTFSKDGLEYILFNEKNYRKFYHFISSSNSFKCITSNMASSYTYLNEKVVLSSLEEILINHTKIKFSIVKYGAGYIEFISKTKKLEITLTQFASYFEKIRFYKIHVKNMSDEDLTVSFQYLLYPVLAQQFINSGRYILTEYNKEQNYVTLQNKVQMYFQKNSCFVTCTDRIKRVYLNNPSFKSFEVERLILGNSSSEIAFTLGVCDNNRLEFLKEKYSNIATINNILTISKNYFKTILNTVHVTTSELEFDYMLNYWALYQTITEKIFNGTIEERLKNSFYVINVLPNTVLDVILNSLYEDLDLDECFYLIYTTFLYISKTEEVEILDKVLDDNQSLFDILEEKINFLIDNEEEGPFFVYKALDIFIELAKMKDKKIDTTSYKKVRDTLEDKLKNVSTDNINDYAYQLLFDIVADIPSKDVLLSRKEEFSDCPDLYLYLLFKFGYYDILYEYYQSMNPIKHHTKLEVFKKYSSFLYHIGANKILGLEQVGKKLYINPHLPSSLNDYKVVYHYLSTPYHIHVVTNQKKSQIIINGIIEELPFIELKNDYKEHEVVVYIKQK